MADRPVIRWVAALAVAAVLATGAGTVGSPTAAAQPAPLNQEDPNPLPDPQVPPPEARQAADEILAGPEYQEPPKSFLQSFLDWLKDRLDRAEPQPRRRTAGPPAARGDASGLGWFMLIVLLAVAAFGASRYRRGARRRKPKDDPLALSESEISLQPDEWLVEAERLERDEQWKEALRCRYRALIGELVDRGIARDLPGRTSGELRSDVRRAAPELSGSFAEASYLFDDAWYGHLPTGRPESEAFRQLADRVLVARRGAQPVAADAGLRGPNADAGLRGPNADAGLRGPNADAGLRGPNAETGGERGAVTAGVTTTARGGGFKIVLAVVAVVGALLVIGALSIDQRTNERYDPRSSGPEGTEALVELLERFGARVEVAQSFPVRADVAIAFPDGVPDSRSADVRQWASGGSTLVMADATSELTPLAEPVLTSASGTLPQGSCDIDGLTDLGPLNLGPRPSYLRFERQPGMPMCWSDGRHAFAALTAAGNGRIVSLGDGTPFQNQNLGLDDNAALATALLAPRPGTRVAILTREAFAGQVTGPPSVSDALDRLLTAYPAIKLVVGQLGIALILFALVRGRRLGRPVAEPQPVQIAGSSLTEAVGRLQRQRRDPDAVARVLRAEARRTVAERSGLPAAAPPSVLANALEARTGRSPQESLAVLDGPPIASDAELVALAEQIDTVVEEVTHGRSP